MTNTDEENDTERPFFCNPKNILIAVLVTIQLSFLVSENKLASSIFESRSSSYFFHEKAVPLRISREVENNLTNNDNSSYFYEREKKRLVSSSTAGAAAEENYLTTTRYIPGKGQKNRYPNWMVAVDCSSYDMSCISYHVAKQRYASYPFNFNTMNRSDFVEIRKDSDNNLTSSWLNTKEPFVLRHNLDAQSSYTLNKYPEKSSESDRTQCIQFGRKATYEEQLDKVLNRLEKDTAFEDMISFTISDYRYTYDMIHDFFQMSLEFVTNNTNSVFMVALDQRTLKEACKYGYPVVHMAESPSNKNNKKFMVQQSKFLVSRDIVERGYNFLFFEMDIWWIQSPIQHLKNQGNFDIAVSGHQDNPNGQNIGFYAVRSNNRTKEFFRELFHLIESRPTVFDQFAFQELFRIAQPWNAESGNFTNEERWGNVTAIPKMKNKLRNAITLGNVFAAQEWPLIHENTLAVHVLSGRPLSTPNGKKMIAKELGAWYGFHTRNGDNNNNAGYYERTGKQNRRYLMLDGFSWMSWDAQEDLIYHSDESMEVAIAFLVAIARQTDRILILPKFFHDRAASFLWLTLDLESLEGIVEFRETNFINNPKAWFKEDQPFESVARTAIGMSFDKPEEIKLFAQPRNNNTVQAWRFSQEELSVHFVDIWFQLMTSKGFDDSELLLVYPQFLHQSKHIFYTMDRSPLLNEIRMLIAERIKWCQISDYNGASAKMMEVWPVGRSASGDDCYGKGTIMQHYELHLQKVKAAMQRMKDQTSN